MRKNKNFSEEEKQKLKVRLYEVCEISWQERGYKKTSINYLTTKVGISTGAFYLLFDNKEQLFSQTLKNVQEKLKLELEEILEAKPNRDGFQEAMKWMYREYDNRRYLYDFNNPDFQSFISKIPVEEIANLKVDSINYSEYIIEKADLSFKVEKQLAYDTIQALFYTVSIQDSILENKIETFNFILDNIICEIFD